MWNEILSQDIKILMKQRFINFHINLSFSETLCMLFLGMRNLLLVYKYLRFCESFLLLFVARWRLLLPGVIFKNLLHISLEHIPQLLSTLLTIAFIVILAKNCYQRYRLIWVISYFGDNVYLQIS